MADIKWNDGKIVFGEDGFEVNSGDVEKYGKTGHNETNALETIGAGSKKTIHLDPTILPDDGYIDLPAETNGRGFILVGDGEYWVDFEWDRFNTVLLIDGTGSTNPYNADEDDKFCVFDNTDSVRIKNRLGAAKRIMFDAAYTEEPLAPTFRVFNIPSGVDNLDPSLTINGTTVTPTFRYFGGDANATNWVAAGYGETLTLQAGTAPTYNNGSPGLGPNDDSVLFNNGGYYLGSGDSGYFTTGDLAFEIVFQFTGITNEYLAGNWNTSTSRGWIFYNTSTTTIRFFMDDTSGIAYVTTTTALTAGTWYYVAVFVNRDENSSNGASIFVNSVSDGTGNLSTMSGSVASDDFAIGARSGGNSECTGPIAYLAGWEQADWHQAGADGPAEWAIIAKERFAKFCGYYPEIAHNTNVIADGDMEAVGVADWTAADSTLSKDTTAPLYEGSQHLRITSTGSTFWARQTILTIGRLYRVTGAARSVSDSAIPQARETGVELWTGTTSTDWQEFDFVFTASSTTFSAGSESASGVVDFDNVTVTQINYMPTTAERTYPAYIDKMEGDYRKLYYVGSEWLRMCHRQDSNGVNVRGYLPETEAENVIIESEDFSTTWSKADAGDTINTDATVAPDGRLAADSIRTDNSYGQHGVRISPTLTVDTYAFSVYAKPGDKNWLRLNNSTVANCDCYFNVSTGAIGTTGAAATGYIEGPFYSGDSTPFYRCCIVFTGTAAANSLQIRVTDGDTDINLTGGDGGTDNMYFWGAQCELGDYMTSPIITDGGVASRLGDSLVYVAGDNIGGEDVGQGTVVLDVLFSDYDKTSSAAYFYWIGDGTASADRVYGQPNASDNFLPGTRASGLDSGDPGAPAVDIVDGIKHSLRHTYEEDSTIGYVDGLAGTEDTSCDIPDDVDTIFFARNNAALLQPNSLIQNFRIYGVPTTKG